MKSNSQEEYQNIQEIDLRDVILPMWNARVRIVVTGILFAALTYVYQIGGLVVDRSQIASVQIHFNFKGASESTYPNGTRFSPQELLAGSVLSEIYHKLEDKSFTYKEFVDSITLKPNFDGSEDLEQIVNTLVSKDKSLTTKDFGLAVAEYTSILSRYAKTNVTLILDLEKINVDLDRADYILGQIPYVWANQALKDRGVLESSLPPISNLENPDISGDFLIQVNILSDTYSVINEQVVRMLSNSTSRTISDPLTGQTLTDLRHRLSVEYKYRISILSELVVNEGIGFEDDNWQKVFREARLSKLERHKVGIEQLITVYENSLSEYSQQQGTKPQSDSGSKSQNSEMSFYGTQYSDDIIDKLLQLGSQMSDPAYRKQLMEEKIALSKELRDTEAQIEFYKLQDQREDNSYSAIRDEVEAALNESYKALSAINNSLLNISETTNRALLDERGQLYDLVGIAESNNISSASKGIKIRIFAGFTVGMIFAITLVLFRRLFSYPTTLANS